VLAIATSIPLTRALLTPHCLGRFPGYNGRSFDRGALAITRSRTTAAQEQHSSREVSSCLPHSS
jgi:hypothetical protein